MKKLNMKTTEVTEENIDKLAALFPHCITEVQEEDGTITRGVDFNLLKQEFSNSVVDGPRESYTINWPGKKASLISANTPINKTLRPCREESVNFDTTENLYIEGDNLEALKLLQESYLGKIKMIYIDPPYNTGKDFVYKDNFTRSEKEELEESGQRDNEGGRLIANTESNGRYHSDWMSMMYPRLKLARNLLQDKGSIFISIDDNEVSNLRKICDEIFGEENFVSNIIWQKKYSKQNDSKTLSNTHDHILLYAKKKEIWTPGKIDRKEDQLKGYKNIDNDERGRWQSVVYTCNKTRAQRPNLYYPIVNPYTGKEIYPNENRVWAYEKSRTKRMLDENRLWWGIDGKLEKPRLKTFLNEVGLGLVPDTLWLRTEVGDTQDSAREILSLFDTPVFDTPKPTKLIERQLNIGTNENDIILDFFSGSSTTAHAIMNVNANNKSKRKYICIQLAEKTNEKSDGFKSGYKTIAEIGKERIRRAGKKIKEENKDKEGIEDLDIGFRVLKIASSNMKDVYYKPDQMSQSLLDSQEINIKEDRTDEDLLFQILLDWGVDLTLAIKREKINNKEVYFVDEDTLAACFENDLDEEFVRELANRKVMRVVFKESGFGSDEMKINIEQIFAQLSPDTEVRGI